MSGHSAHANGECHVSLPNKSLPCRLLRRRAEAGDSSDACRGLDCHLPSALSAACSKAGCSTHIMSPAYDCACMVCS